MKNRPLGVVTKTGRFVRQAQLEQYALKADEESKQLVDPFQSIYGQFGLATPIYNPDALARAPEANTYHMRAAKTKARDVAGLGWSLQPRVEKPSDEQRKTAVEFLESLVERGHPIGQVLGDAQYDYETVGWAAVEIVREGHRPDGPPVLLTHVPAHTLRRHLDGKRVAQTRGGKRRWFRLAGSDFDVHQDQGTVTELGRLDPNVAGTELLWWRNSTSRSAYYGIPDIIPALGALQGDLGRRDFNISFFENSGVPAWAVFVTGNFDEGPEDEDGLTELDRYINDKLNEVSSNPGSTLVFTIPSVKDPLEGGGREGGGVKVTFERLAIDVEDATFRMYRVDNRDEIIHAHGVPPYRLGIAAEGSLGGSTARESTEIYRTSVLDPRQETIEVLITHHVLAALEVTDWTFTLTSLDTTDDQAEWEILNGLWKAGSVTPREVRRRFADRFGLDPEADSDPALDWHYIDGRPITGPLAGITEEDQQVDAVLRSVRDGLVSAAVKDGQTPTQIEKIRDPDTGLVEGFRLA